MNRSTWAVIVVTLGLLPWPVAAQQRKTRAIPFTASAYCKTGETASGSRARSGIVAADPRVIPMGSTIRLSGPGLSRPTTYVVEDAGVKGRRIDIFMPSCREARRFGKRRVRVTVVSHGRVSALMRNRS